MIPNTTQSSCLRGEGPISLARARRAQTARLSDGFSMIEMTVVLLIAMIIAGMAVPVIKSSVNSYRLRSAVAVATWAIQSTRFQALMESYAFQVTIQGDSSGNNPTYQIANEPPGATTFTSVGTAVPLSSSPVNLTAATIVQFKPNGTVTVTQGGSCGHQFSDFVRRELQYDYGLKLWKPIRYSAVKPIRRVASPCSKCWSRFS